MRLGWAKLKYHTKYSLIQMRINEQYSSYVTCFQISKEDYVSVILIWQTWIASARFLADFL